MDEFVIEWLRGQATATITAPNASKLKNKVLKLSTEHPEDCIIITENDDGSILAHIPIKYIKVGAPRTVSEKTVERLKEYRARINAKTVLNDSDEDLSTEE